MHNKYQTYAFIISLFAIFCLQEITAQSKGSVIDNIAEIEAKGFFKKKIKSINETDTLFISEEWLLDVCKNSVKLYIDNIKKTKKISVSESFYNDKYSEGIKVLPKTYKGPTKMLYEKNRNDFNKADSIFRPFFIELCHIVYYNTVREYIINSEKAFEDKRKAEENLKECNAEKAIITFEKLQNDTTILAMTKVIKNKDSSVEKIDSLSISIGDKDTEINIYKKDINLMKIEIEKKDSIINVAQPLIKNIDDFLTSITTLPRNYCGSLSSIDSKKLQRDYNKTMTYYNYLLTESQRRDIEAKKDTIANIYGLQIDYKKGENMLNTKTIDENIFLTCMENLLIHTKVYKGQEIEAKRLYDLLDKYFEEVERFNNEIKRISEDKRITELVSSRSQKDEKRKILEQEIGKITPFIKEYNYLNNLLERIKVTAKENPNIDLKTYIIKIK